MKHAFASEYILSNKTYKEAIKKSSFAKPTADSSADIYIFSAVVIKDYRDVKMPVDRKSKFYKKSAFKVLNEALVDWICDVKQKGVSINYIFSEKVSEDGEKYLKSLDMQPCLLMNDDCKYAKLFTPSMFSKCGNINKLYNLYLNENLRTPFDSSILKGHEYLSLKNNNLYYKDINLYQLVEKYGAPLEVAYTPMITEKIQYLKNLFVKKIKKYRYPKQYNYAYATKANYYSEVVLTALIYPDYDKFKGCDENQIIETMRGEVAKINKMLASFKQVRSIEIQKTEFEKTTTKKIIRYKLS